MSKRYELSIKERRDIESRSFGTIETTHSNYPRRLCGSAWWGIAAASTWRTSMRLLPSTRLGAVVPQVPSADGIPP